MTDKIHEAIVRGDRAKSLLNDELLKESLSALEASYIEAWRFTHARDTDARERLWQAVHVVSKVRDHLAKVASGGAIARAELDQLIEREKRQ